MSRLWLFAAVVGSVALSWACRGPLPAAEADWRAARERAVRQELPTTVAATFTGLRYFGYNPAYVFRAMLEPVVPPRALTMAASDGSVRPAHQVGRVTLAFPNGTATLAVFTLDDSPAPDMLFLPFRDAGAGTSTYGAGRYVELERLAGGVVEIDFNRAYNPDCAYGISAQCPITPKENTLGFAVEAGEMMPAGHA